MVRYRICPGKTFGMLTILLRFEQALSLLIGRYVPTMAIHMHNKDKFWIGDQCRRAFDLKLEAHLRWTRDGSQV